MLGLIWHDQGAQAWDARRGSAGRAGAGEAAPSHHNPCMGKGNNAGLKKASVVFISYNPNDVFWIALLRG